MRNTFKKYERLKREQHISTLFRIGKAFSVLQLRFIYRLVPREEGEYSPVRAGFSVPKKKFRSSVMRHHIRRLMVEAWRMNKYDLYKSIPEGQQLHIFIVNNNTQNTDFPTLQDIIKSGINQLTEQLRSE